MDAPAGGLRKTVTVEQYLRIESRAVRMHEFYNGEMFVRQGENVRNASLSVRLGCVLPEPPPYTTYAKGLRVRVNPAFYAYPDLIMVCGEAQVGQEEQDTLLNPAVLFEILSPKSEAFDRGPKLEHYPSIPSLQEYVLVSQDEPYVEVYRRGDPWTYHEASGMDATIELASISYTLRLRDLYEGILAAAETSA